MRRDQCIADEGVHALVGVALSGVTGAALAHPVSRQWKGYWQRSAA
jgi:hypothetical protein